jgi:DNA-binding NarL/FixJ family response regulator
MRALVVGPPLERARLRAELLAAGVGIAGEFSTLAAARASGVAADAIVIAASQADRPDEDPPGPETLTARELEVLNLLAEGLPNKAIGDRLGISDQTVKFHVASITGKLGASNRTEAVRIAVRRGMITI